MSTHRAPSLKRLEDAFPGKGAELRDLLKGKVKTNEYLSVQDLQRACYNPPDYAHRLMTALNEVTEGYGIEAMWRGSEVVAEYVNHGDSYATTLIRKCDTGTVMLGCWADFAESNGL